MDDEEGLKECFKNVTFHWLSVERMQNCNQQWEVEMRLEYNMHKQG